MGFILGPPLSGVLSHIGTQHGMAGNLLPGLAAGAMSFTALAIAFFVLGESKPPDLTGRSGVPPQFDKHVWAELGQRRLLGAIMITLFLQLLAVAGMETSVTLHARDRFHFSQLDLAYFFLFMGVIVAVIQGGLIGRLAKAVGERTLVAIGTLSYTAGLLLVPSIWRVPMLYVVAFLIAIGTGLAYPSLTSMVSKASPANEQGSMLGIATATGSLARFVGPIAMGFLYDLAQARGAFYGGAVLTAGAFVIAMWMRSIEWQS
jgi:DHA1 family tetracycline resistance protein-like MFS transporter